MANFVVESHIRHHPSNDLEEMERQGLEADSIADLNENTPGGVEKIPQELLKKYIIYAKEKVHPKLHNMDQVRLMKICMIEFTDANLLCNKANTFKSRARLSDLK